MVRAADLETYQEQLERAARRLQYVLQDQVHVRLQRVHATQKRVSRVTTSAATWRNANFLLFFFLLIRLFFSPLASVRGAIRVFVGAQRYFVKRRRSAGAAVQ